MAHSLLGEASGGFTESSSALRLMHPAIRNTVGRLTNDGFTQTNPPVVTVASTISARVDTLRMGVLSGSIAFSRPDVGPNYIGGNVESLANAALETFIRPLGVFINSANGNSFENVPALASGKCPYMSGQGTYGNALFETQALAAVTGISQGAAITYTPGVDLIASRNGYLMPREADDGTGTVRSLDTAGNAAEVEHGRSASTAIAVLKIAADSHLNELVYDQRL